MWGRKIGKFGAIKTGGMASKLEAVIYRMLVERQMRGEIHDLKSQVRLILQDGPRVNKITWRVDFGFVVTATGRQEYCEAKGFPTDVYKIKLKLYRGIKSEALEIWGGSFRNPKLIERIEAKE